MITSRNEELNVKKLFLVILYIFCVYVHAAQLGAAGGMVSSCKVWPVVASSPAHYHLTTLRARAGNEPSRSFIVFRPWLVHV